MDGVPGRLDVLVTSSCRKTLGPTLRSFRSRVRFSGRFRFLVNVDVLDPGYLPRLLAMLAEHGIDDANLSFEDGRRSHRHARAFGHLLGRVESEFYFHLEDDWVFRRKIDLDRMLLLMQRCSEIDQVRFNATRTRADCWLYHRYAIDDPAGRVPNQPMSLGGVDLVRSFVWSFNPSLVRTSALRSLAPIPTDQGPERFVCFRYLEKNDPPGTFILGRIGDPPMVRHIGGKGGWHPLRKRLRRWRRRLASRFS
jgi:hypothetical protein